MTELPRVITRQEYGRRGYEVTLARYGKRQMDAWRRMGGRPKDPTYDEIVAAQAATRREKRRVSTDRRRPSRND